MPGYDGRRVTPSAACRPTAAGARCDLSFSAGMIRKTLSGRPFQTSRSGKLDARSVSATRCWPGR